MITVIVNGNKYKFSDRTSVAQVLHSLDISIEPGIAVALNNYVLPMNDIGDTSLKNEDKLEIIHATAGG